MPTPGPMRLSRPVVMVLGLPRHLYRHGWGWLLGRRFLQLTHTGRRSGRTFTTVLEVVRPDPDCGEVMVVSGFGPGSDWLRNIRSDGRAEISTGRESFAPRSGSCRPMRQWPFSRTTSAGTAWPAP